MRNTIVYVLRLLVDDNRPDELHGILRNVLTGQEQSFSDPRGLLDLLQAKPPNCLEQLDSKLSPKPGIVNE